MVDAQAVTALMAGKAKPANSLGSLEKWSEKLCLLQDTLTPSISKGALLVFVGDHGVALPTEQGGEACSAFPSAVTPSVAKAMAKGGAAGAVLARSVGMDVRVVDVGMAVDLDVPNLHVDKAGKGTKCFTKEPAMTPEECEAALAAGRRAVQALGPVGAVSLGEIGIGNTTASAALVAAFGEAAPEETCGRGTGLDAQGVARKVEIVRRGLERHAEVLAALGGFEIAAIVGALQEAAGRGVAVLVDGFIATAAALVAVRADPEVGRALFLATNSAESGHRLAIQALSHELPAPLPPPALDMQLALGEGTGGVLCFPILKGACDIATQMMSLEEALKL